MESNLLCFKRTPILTALSLPKIYKEGFFTESGVWTKLIIIKGKMKFADYNAEFLHELTDISIKEQLDINVIDHDITKANIKGSYDFIFSTDVFMYLNPTRIQSIITNIKQQTHLNGYNLIVSALNATRHGRPLMPLPFTFIEGELKEYYKDWKIISYSENITASPYPYAMILAQKVSE